MKFKNTQPTKDQKPFDIKPLKKQRHWKLWIIFGIFMMTLIAMAGYGVKSFNDKYFFASPIQARPINIISPVASESAKKPITIKVVEPVQAQEVDNPSDHEIAEYIASKDWDYGTAIRLAKSENAWNSRGHFDCTINNAGTNKDGSIDYGIMQINSIHRAFVEDYYSRPFEEVVTNCKDNIDVAYMIYQRNNNIFNPWSAYNNGSYKGHSIIEL